MRVGDVVDARGESAVNVVRAHDQGGNHLGVFAFGAGVGAVLTVAGDVENRPEFALQLQRVAHEVVRACVVVDRRQDGEWLFAREQDIAWVAHDWLSK